MGWQDAPVVDSGKPAWMTAPVVGAPPAAPAAAAGSAVPPGTRLPSNTPAIPGQEVGTIAQQPEAPRPQYGILDKLKAVGEAFIDQALGSVGGLVGTVSGGAYGIAKDIAGLATQGTAYRGNEAKRLSEQAGQAQAENARTGFGLFAKPSPLGQDYSEDLGSFIQTNAPSVAAGPLGVVGLTRARPTPQAVEAVGAKMQAAKVGAAQDAALARPELESIRAAHDAGYKLTPKAAKAGVAARAVETAAGSPRLAQELAAHNAENTARLARRDVGLPDDVPATPEATAKIREEAGQDYAAVKEVGQFENDAQYTKDLDSIIGPVKAAADDYPGLLDSPLFKHIEALRQGEVSTASAVEAVKQLRSKADVAFRAGDKRLGGAYRAAAEAVDGSMDRALGQMAENGDPALAEAVDKYRAARVRIAKTYLLDDAMDGKPGEVNAKAYARALDKGVPLTGDAKTIAEFAKNFGDEGLAAKKGKSGAIGPTWHDIILGALVHPGSLAAVPAVVARPVARRVLGSDFAQRKMAGSKPAPVDLPPLEPAVPRDPGVEAGFEGVPQNPSPNARPAPTSPLGDLTPDWQTAPGAADHAPSEVVPTEGLVPAVGETQPMRVQPAGVAPEAEGAALRGAGEQIPAVPGRPDLPDTMVVGPPAEAGATEATGAAMQAPEAALARQKQAEVLQQRAQAVQSPEVKRVLETQAAKLALEAKRMKDAHDLRMEAAVTDDPAIRQALLDHAKRLERAEKVAVGEAKEGMPKEKPAKAEKIPAGEATEVTPEEVVAPNPDLVFETGKGWVKRSIPAGEATELPAEVVVYDAKGRALQVGRTYQDSKGRRAVWQADGTWKILK